MAAGFILVLGKSLNCTSSLPEPSRPTNTVAERSRASRSSSENPTTDKQILNLTLHLKSASARLERRDPVRRDKR